MSAFFSIFDIQLLNLGVAFFFVMPNFKFLKVLRGYFLLKIRIFSVKGTRKSFPFEEVHISIALDSIG